MTADQITAAVKDKNAGIMCVSGKYAGASVNSLAINVDKGSLPVNITIDTDCKASFINPVPVAIPKDGTIPMTVTPSITIGTPVIVPIK
jgi:hypothetical protein